MIKHSLTYSLSLLVLLNVLGCTSNSMQLHHDQNVSFADVDSYYVSSVNNQQDGITVALQQITLDFLDSHGKLVADIEAVDAHFEIDHYEQERPNDSHLSIGLGTGSYGRSGGISIGTNVIVPIGADTLLYAGVTVRIMVAGNLVWSATSYREIADSDILKAKSEALSEIIANFPISRKALSNEPVD